MIVDRRGRKEGTRRGKYAEEEEEKEEEKFMIGSKLMHRLIE